MSIFDPVVVVTPMDVELGEDFSFFELVYKVRDEGKRVGVSNSMLFQVMVVLAGSETTILFFNKEEG